MDKTIDVIRKALEAATPWPWKVEIEGYIGNGGWTEDRNISPDVARDVYNETDAHLIANAPEWLSYLLTELDATKQERNESLAKMAMSEVDLRRELNTVKQEFEELIKERDMYADAMFKAVEELDVVKKENERLCNKLQFVENQNNLWQKRVKELEGADGEDDSTPEVTKEGLKLKQSIEALEEIADYDVVLKHRFRDEWNEAASFNDCQDIAKSALSLIREGESR